MTALPYWHTREQNPSTLQAAISLKSFSLMLENALGGTDTVSADQSTPQLNRNRRSNKGVSCLGNAERGTRKVQSMPRGHE